MGRSFGVPDDIDEDELDAELACLGDEFDEEVEEDVTNPSYMQESGMPRVPLSNVTPTANDQKNETGNKVDEFGLPLQNLA